MLSLIHFQIVLKSIFIPKINIYFLRDFLVDVQSAVFLHYDVIKLN